MAKAEPTPEQYRSYMRIFVGLVMIAIVLGIAGAWCSQQEVNYPPVEHTAQRSQR